MEGSFKTKLNRAQIDQLLRNAVQQSVTSCRELSDGWANTAYLVNLESGESVVMKVAPPAGTRYMRSEQQMMKTEIAVLTVLGQHEHLPIPRIIASDDSCDLVSSEYFVMNCMSGQPYHQLKESMPAAERTMIEEQIGSYNRMLNEYRNDRYGYYFDEIGGSSSWKDAFYGMISGVLADGRDADVELPVSYSKMERVIEQRLGVLDEVKEPRLIHWDLWDGNVFVKDGVVSGIIDFERALWGDPLMEYYFGRLGRTDGFMHGYGITKLTDEEKQRRKLYDLYLDLILVIECVYRQYTDKRHIQWTAENLSGALSLLLSEESPDYE